MDTTGLKAAEAQAKLSGASMSAGLGQASTAARSAEKDVVGLEKRLGAAGLSTGKWTTLLGGGMGLNPALLGAGVAAAALAVAGKSIVDISDQWEAAQKGLAQAADATHTSYAVLNKDVEAFINSNRKFIPNQADVADGFAKLTRSGLSLKEVQRDMNIALDLAALKHIGLADAVDLVDKAEHGRMKGLIDYGITTSKYTDVNGNLILSQHSVAKSMDELEVKVKNGRKATTDLTQAQNQLSNVWQDLAHRTGPPLVEGLAKIVEGLAKVAVWVEAAIGKFADLYAVLDKVGLAIHNALGGLSAPPAPGIRPGGMGRQAGGPVVPNSIYTVGERGPETLVMGAQGGTVIPNGGQPASGGDTYHLHLTGTPVVNDPEGVRRMLQRMRYIGAAS